MASKAEEASTVKVEEQSHEIAEVMEKEKEQVEPIVQPKPLFIDKVVNAYRGVVGKSVSGVKTTGEFVEKQVPQASEAYKGKWGFIFGRKASTTTKGVRTKNYVGSSYVSQQMRKPYRYYAPKASDGPQSVNSDNLPQNWGPAINFRRASTLHLFGEWSGQNGIQSPIAKYGGNGRLPRFWDSKPGANTRKSMFKKGVFG